MEYIYQINFGVYVNLANLLQTFQLTSLT